jgi:hypothetical protein
METIYRVEDENGQGCYSCHFEKLEKMYSRHVFDGINYPRPQEDKGIKKFPEPDEICGFKNIEQALSWFTEEDLKLLKRHGFELKKVEVEAITAVGEKQVLAVRKEKVLYETYK